MSDEALNGDFFFKSFQYMKRKKAMLLEFFLTMISQRKLGATASLFSLRQLFSSWDFFFKTPPPNWIVCSKLKKMTHIVKKKSINVRVILQPIRIQHSKRLTTYPNGCTSPF